jgi:hypothetical protein
MALTAKKVYAILKRQISDMEAKLNSPLRYRGTVATADLLPLNPDIGDMYNIESKSVYGEAGMNVAWNGVVWDTMGAPIDMSLYFTKEEADTTIQNMVNEYFENNPVKPGATTEQAQQIEQNKKDVASLKEDLSTKITKFYASSQGETHLADSDNGKIQDMMVYGKSEQKQYSGKNLLNPTLQTTTQNGVTCTNNGDGTYTVNGTATDIAVFVVYYNFADVYGSASSLKMVGCPSGGSAQKYFLRSYRKGGNPEILDEYGSGISIGSFKESESNIAIIVKSGATVNNLIFKPMLTTDTTATYADFEPYTGGIPSPNPDYPQEIKSVVNPTVKVCGKNLLNLNSYKENVKNGITITPIFNNEELQYLILNGTFKTAEWAVIWIGTLNPGTYTFSTQNSNVKILRNWSEQNNTFTVTDENSVYRIVINSSNMGESVKDVKIYPQLELGSTPTAYEPYHEQTVTLPYTLNAIPVNSGGNVTIDGQQYIADYVDVERGKLVRNVLVKTFTGNEGWDYSDATDDSKKRFYLEINKKIKSAIGISNYLRSIGADIKKGDNCFAAYTRSLDVRITSIASLAEFKSFLARLDSNGKPLNVLFALDTPEEIDLTQEEISAFKALSTNYPVTNIEVSSDQLDGYTVFNYPISMANGWNYVKKQLNDNRDYIYDMDMQSAEAYVNSEYAVALTELEV